MLLNVDDRDWRRALAETPANGGEKFRAVMRGRMDDEQCDCAVIGGQFGFVDQRGVIGPAIRRETTFGSSVHRLEAQGESDFAVDIDVGIVVVVDGFAILVFVGGDAVADEDDGAGKFGFGRDGQRVEVVADFP